MIEKIEKWIDDTNSHFFDKRQSCAQFSKEFAGFYSTEFLSNAYFVVVDSIPKPDFPELQDIGINDFLAIVPRGITYKNTYYLIPSAANNLRVHFHELVHVAQWQHLGAPTFIQRYMAEIQRVGYADSPFEKCAYELDTHYSNGGDKIDVPALVAGKL